MSISEYGDMTPRELMLVAEEYNHKRQLQREDLITQAYLVAAWQRAKRMPKLAKVLEDSRPKRPATEQTPEQMLAFVKVMHAELMKGG